ncbi:MAG: tetratricopeptide repeat protein [Thermodesulfobacteriota bacterium]|nr:tetratricopeptide repeat protein [Thermodesulfobacteriota bacterium]
MTKKIKVEKKGILKKPDEFVSSSQKISNFFLENQKKILGILITLCVLILFLFGWRFYSQKTDREAYLIYNQAVQYYNSDDASGTSIKEETERYNQAITSLEEVINGYSHTNVFPLALLYSGHIYYKLKKLDESIESYLRFIEKESSYNSLKVFAFAGLGYAYEAKGDYRNALVYFIKLTERDKNPFAQLGYLDLSRCYDSLGEKNKAIEACQTLLTNYPNSVFAALAKKKMSILR